MIKGSVKGLINNEWDRENLEFLLNTKGDDFTAFWEQSDEDDRIYAQELLDAYSLELQLRAQELEIESQLTDVSVASNLLQKFAL
jgi:hypothetical protein